MFRSRLVALVIGAAAAWTNCAAAIEPSSTSRYLITLKAEQDVAEVSQEVARLSEKVSRFSTRVLSVETNQPQVLLQYLKSHRKVIFVEAWSDPVQVPIKVPLTVPFNLNSQLTHNVPLLRQRYGLTGNGVTVGLWDGGPVLASHVEFGGRIETRVAGEPHDHATHVAGTIAAEGVDKQAGGMAPKAKILSFGLADDLSQMEHVFAESAGPQVTNHSYNFPRGWYQKEGLWAWCGEPSVSEGEDYLFGKYATRSFAIDDLAARYPDVTIFVAAGNARGPIVNPNLDPMWDGNYYLLSSNAIVNTPPRPPNDQHDGGYDTLEGYSVAKNVITIGAIVDAPLGATRIKPELVKVTDFSSWGPSDDGRVKPDVVANGAHVYSPTVELLPTGYNPYAYGFKDGTSMATPAATGIGALLVELSREKRGMTLRSDEMKVALIHTAISPHEGPTYEIGWGAIDAEAAGTLIAGDSGFLIRGALTESQSFRLRAEPVGGKVRVSLAWIDPAGEPNRGGLNDRRKALVFDLDLILIDPLGKRHYPWSLDPTNPAKPATRSGPNHQDNVERIDVADNTIPAGDWTIEVAGPPAAVNHGFALALTGLGPK